MIDQPNSSHILSDDEKQAIHCASFDLQENHENYTTWSVSLIGFSWFENLSFLIHQCTMKYLNWRAANLFLAVPSIDIIAKHKS